MSLKPLSSLPWLRACTVGELRRGKLDDAPASADPQPSDAAASARVVKTTSINKGGRCIVSLPTGRDVVVAVHRGEVFAFDRNCYHVGYPLDMGPIEDLAVRTVGAAVPTRGRAATTEAGVVFTPVEGPLRSAELDCESTAEDPEAAPFATVTCPLHNRIFDLRTGDMIVLEMNDPAAAKPANTDDEAAATPASQEPQRTCRAVSTACKQRIHKVVIAADDAAARATGLLPPDVAKTLCEGLLVTSVGGAATKDTDAVYVVDSFGYSNPVTAKHVPGVRHAPRVAVPSDGENIPKYGAPGDAAAVAAPATTEAPATTAPPV